LTTTEKLCVTDAAASQVAFPAWLAITEHLPTPPTVIVLPETVQTAGVVDAKLTAKPELAEAPITNGGVPEATLPSGPNVIVWTFVLVTVNA
jgi:hypothetical protein